MDEELKAKIKPHANLRGADLRGADLYGADLYGANLCGANLCGADLYGANLCGANLYGANLCGANLYGANLCGANLRGAKLPDNFVCGPQRSDGYRFDGYLADGIVWVRAGCRYFTMTNARAHWQQTRAGTPLGQETMIILDFIEARFKK